MRDSSRRLPVVLAVLWAIAAGASGAAIGEERLESAIAELITAPEFKTAHWGLLVVDLETGAPLYELNADRLFAPASVTKLFSVATALDEFGPDHRFETPVYARGNVSQGELAGDLVLVATGDLTLGGRTTVEGEIAFTNSDHTYANGGDKGELTAPDPLAGLDELARQVALAGIRRVRGNVLIDDRLFDRETGSGSGPRRVTPIVVNDNLIDFTISPGESGEPARVDWRPQTGTVTVDARIETVAANGPLQTVIEEAGPRRVVLRGTIPAGRKPLVRVYEVADAAAHARGLFIEALSRAGVTVAASSLADHPPADALPRREEYATLKPVARLLSPPFSESARLILKVSHNLHASTLPLLVAARHGERTLAAGLKRQRDFLIRLGVDVETISFGGGAGGAAADFVTPRATVQLLRGMHARGDAAVYRRAMPLLGVDGTLSEAVPSGSPARGQFSAKTGTLYWDNVLNGRSLLTSKALAGYAATAAGRPLAFAIFVNNVHLKSASETSRIGQTLGRLCEILHSHSGASR